MPEEVNLTVELLTGYIVKADSGEVIVTDVRRYLDADGATEFEKPSQRVISPLDDLEDEPEEARTIALAVRTPERIARYEKLKAEADAKAG